MFVFDLLEIFILFCVGISALTLLDILINAVKDLNEQDEEEETFL